ncbi:hypothetical protein LC55x_0271 [Lysobacter capsici]|nr:hypothetical protein LC55x_0271 [Lysobacter capsici]
MLHETPLDVDSVAPPAGSLYTLAGRLRGAWGGARAAISAREGVASRSPD